MDVFDQIATIKTGEPIKLIAYHGSDALFDEFRLSTRNGSPGIWFSIDKDYVTCIGENVYECEITLENVARCEDLDDDTPSRSRLAEMGYDGLIMQFPQSDEDRRAGVPRDAFIIARDVESIKILNRRPKMNLEQSSSDEEVTLSVRM